MYIDRTLKEYFDDLAAKRPAPGGGSASAAVAATGTSLMRMVANFTAGKPEYGEVQDKVARISEEALKLDSRFRALIDDDVMAYEKLASALKGRKAGEAVPESLYKDALKPPFEVCELTGKAMKLCRELVECGNKKLITDTAIAAILFEAAFFSAKFNVYVNLRFVKDTDHIAGIHRVVTALEESMPKVKEEILELCEDVISS
ncbi:MAG: cyclodeaminase/cyclohydrolase family protein [Candidatus Omnitrophota bacterium]